MRIVYLCERFVRGGHASPSRVASLARRWAGAGHDVVVVAAAEGRPALRRESHEGLRVIRTPQLSRSRAGPILRAASFGAASLVLAPLLGELRGADVIIAPTDDPLAPTLGWALSRALRAVFVVEEACGADLGPGLLGATARRLDAAAQARAARRITRRDGLDVAQYTPWPRDAAQRAELGLGDGVVVAWFAAGTVAPPPLLRAADRLPEVEFLLVGAAPSAAAPNVVAIATPVAGRRARYLAAADLIAVLAAPSRIAPAPTVLEAMASARPVLVATAGASGALVEEAGAGWSVPPADTDAIVAAVAEASADPIGLGARGEVGRVHVEAHHDADRIADEYLSTLLQLLRERARR